jgi:hypothetical protein
LWQLFCFVEDRSSSPTHDGAEKDSTNPMLTAHRQEPQSGAASLVPGTQADGFAKVLTSIQGLQQRLDGFSVEEASQAEANVGTIVQQLCTIQAKLRRVTELKHFVASTNRMISEIPEQNLERVDLDGLENHPQLHAIIQASKLIRVHKLMQATKADTAALSMHDEATTLQIPDPEASSFAIAASSLAAPSHPTVLAKQTDLHEMQTVDLKLTSENLPGGDWVFSADTELEDTQPQFVEHTVSIINDGENELTREAIAKIPKPTGAETSGVAGRTEFDERLLSDLIQAYGEFSPVVKSSSATTQPIGAEIEQPSDQVITSSPMPHATGQESSSEPELIRQDSAKLGLPPPEKQPTNSHDVVPATEQAAGPKNISQESKSTTGLTLVRTALPILPQAQAERAKPESEKKRLPNTKKHGELDRQLKNIIKDYGEYDLYSHQSSTNLKKLALAAFAALALVLGVLYFFRAPSRPRNPAASAVTQSPHTSNTLENSADAAQRPTLKPKLETNKTLTGE